MFGLRDLTERLPNTCRPGYHTYFPPLGGCCLSTAHLMESDDSNSVVL